MRSQGLLLASTLTTAASAQWGKWGHHDHHDQEYGSLAWQSLPGSIYSPPPADAWAKCKDASWPISDVGTAIVPQTPDDELKEMLAEIDPDRVKYIIEKLVSFGTRHTLSSQDDPERGIGAARDWIMQEMQSFAGDNDVYLNSYIEDEGSRIPFPVNISNVVMQINGTEDPTRAHVVSGHYDSRTLDVLDYELDAPGADDDASGIAVAMEMARVCAKRKPKTTMIFSAVAAEEQGLYGSAHLAKTLKEQGYNVEGHWNNDIVGTGKSEPYNPINDYTVRLFGPSIYYPNVTSDSYEQTIGLIGGWNDSPNHNFGRFIAELAAGAAEYVGMQVALIYRADRFLRGGDHLSFIEQGFPGVRFTEAVENFLHQHQDVREADGVQYGDLIEYVDFDYTARVARTNLVSMWAAANAPALPQNVSISQEVGFPAADRMTPLELIGQESQFCWATGNDPMAVGYELVWRTSTNSQWTNSLELGNVGTVTTDLLKDNVQVGIRAVGADGRKSPAVFPLPVSECPV